MIYMNENVKFIILLPQGTIEVSVRLNIHPVEHCPRCQRMLAKTTEQPEDMEPYRVYTATEIARRHGFSSARKLNLFLKEIGLITQHGQDWKISEGIKGKNYEDMKSGHLLWTQTGYDFLSSVLTKFGFPEIKNQ